MKCPPSVPRRCLPQAKKDDLSAKPRDFSLEEAVRCFRLLIPECQWNGELEYFKRLSFDDAIESAASAIDEQDKRFGHQTRIPAKSLKVAKVAISRRAARFKGCQNFDELIAEIGAAVADIYRIGELYVYDTALRLGAHLGKMPDKIYLHRGTRDGARMLGLEWRQPFILKKSLPAILQSFKPYEIEDFLCYYAHRFRKSF